MLLPCPSVAQDARGTVHGRVTDASGAVIPEADVRITNDSTGVSAVARSNDAGNWVLPYLLPGTYTLHCEFQGFKSWTRPGIQVRINDSVDVNITLEVGTTSETVTVTDTTPLLSSSEASLGQVVDERRVLDLPLFAGNAMDLVHLAPGTVNGTDMRLRKAGFNNAPSQFSTDGGGNYQNEFSIDGVSNTYSDGTSPRVAFSPPQTAISEFKIQTSVFDASLGHTMGSTVNVSTKAGTNTIHGEMHEWFRHSALDAPDIFQNRSGQGLAVYQDNRYGLSVGAPVVLPKLYNGKNRTFWFFAWEANKFGSAAGGSATSTVPTAKMRNGDFSEYLALGSTYQLYDPFTTVKQGDRYVRQPIPGNIIPPSRLDPVGKKMMELFPLPNQAGTRDFLNNYFRTGKALEDYWVWLARFDHAFSDKHRIFVRLHRDFWEEDKNRWFNNDVNGIILNRNNKGIAFDDVYVFSPTFLMNFRYGITFQDFPERRVSQGYDLSQLGFSQQLLSLIPNKALATIPYINIAPYTVISNWESGDGYTASTTNSFVYNLSKLQGNHNLRFGPEFRLYRESRNRYNTSISPQFTFSAAYTKATDTSSNPTRGGEAAAMLLGIPAGSMSITDSYVEQDKYLALYVQDDWKIRKNLTLNLGLRWEIESPMTERFDRSALHYAFGTPNPMNDAARANYAKNPIPELPPDQFSAMGGLTFAGPNNRDYWSGEKNNLAPRFGLAYQPTPKTVIRAGYGIFFASIGVNYTNTNLTGFSQATPMQASFDNGLTYVATNANPFPTGLIPPPKSSAGLMTNVGQGVGYFAQNRKHPYSQRWSVGLQYELPMKLMVEASYVGNRNTRININREFSYTPAQYLSKSPVRDQATIDYLGKTYPNPYYGLNPIYGTTMTRANLLRPYNQFSSVQLQGDPAGYSWYHSMQSRIERRFGDGWTAQFSYTYSRAMEATEFMNSSDPMPYEVVSALDRPHRVSGSGIWELPYGHGRRWGTDSPSVVNFILGGWQFNAIYQHQSGAPLGFGNRIFTGNLDDIVLPEGKRSVDGWFNVNAGFERSSAKQLASNIRTFPLRFTGVRGPTQDRWDFSMIKNFRISERFNSQFRAETFNAMNHPNLADPNTDPTSSAFGTITSQNPPRSWQLSLKITF
jgi:hypothetical protein